MFETSCEIELHGKRIGVWLKIFAQMAVYFYLLLGKIDFVLDN